MKTVLQELIEIIQDHAESYKGKNELHVKKAYLDIICAVEDLKLLEKEKEQIKEAFREGENNIDFPALHGQGKLTNANKYYKETYEPKS